MISVIAAGPRLIGLVGAKEVRRRKGVGNEGVGAALELLLHLR